MVDVDLTTYPTDNALFPPKVWTTEGVMGPVVDDVISGGNVQTAEKEDAVPLNLSSLL